MKIIDQLPSKSKASRLNRLLSVFHQLLSLEPQTLHNITVYLIMVLGCLMRSLWGYLLAYIHNPSINIAFEPPLAIFLRILVCLTAATLTFVKAQDEIERLQDKKPTVYAVAFALGYAMMYYLELQ